MKARRTALVTGSSERVEAVGKALEEVGFAVSDRALHRDRKSAISATGTLPVDRLRNTGPRHLTSPELRRFGERVGRPTVPP